MAWFTARARTEGGQGTGCNKPHPQGRTHWSNPVDPPGQWQELQGHWSEPGGAASGSMANIARSHGNN